MVANITQKDYLSYFDAALEFSKIAKHGISNVYVDEGGTLTPVSRDWLHARIVDISRFLKSLFSKKKRLERQAETDRKLNLLSQHIQTINQTNERLRKIVNEHLIAVSPVSSDYYTLKAASLFERHFQAFEKWNQKFQEPKKRSWQHLKSVIRKFNGYHIPSAQEKLKISNQADKTLVKIPIPNFYDSLSQPFIEMCHRISSLRSKLTFRRLQTMGGFVKNASDEAAKILKEEKSSLGDMERKAFEHVNKTASDPKSLEAYWEAMRITSRPGAHDQLELPHDAQILHYKTQVGESLEVFFQNTKSTELLFKLLPIAKHHFCRNDSSIMQAIHSVITNCLTPYCQAQFKFIEEESLLLWLKQLVALFPKEKEDWIKALFFDQVVYTLYIKDHLRKESLIEFSKQNLTNKYFPEALISEKLVVQSKAST